MYCDECGKFHHASHIDAPGHGGNFCHDCQKAVQDEHERMRHLLRDIVSGGEGAPSDTEIHQMLREIDERRERARGNSNNGR